MTPDQLTFTPPSLDDLTEATERAQKTIKNKFLRYLTGHEAASPLEHFKASRSLRHVTAVQVTLRKTAGPLFDPASPVPVDKRIDLINRRLDKVDAAFDSPQVESVLPFDARSSAFPEPAPRTSDAVFVPPDIEDLVTAFEFAAKVTAMRWEKYQHGDWPLSPDDAELECLALRDLTAVGRTLRRLSGHKLPEDHSPTDLEIELDRELAGAPPDSAANSPLPSFQEASLSPPPISNVPRVEDDAAPPSQVSNIKSGITYSQPPVPSPSTATSAPIQNPQSEIPNPSAPSPDIESSIPNVSAEPLERPVRPVPPVPDVRPIAPSHTAGSSRIGQTPNPSRRSHKKSGGARLHEPDQGPAPWPSPASLSPGPIDEGAPEFLADIRAHGYPEARRRALERLHRITDPPDSTSPPSDAPDPPPD